MSIEPLLEELRERLRCAVIAASNDTSTSSPVPDNISIGETIGCIKIPERSNQETYRESDVDGKRKELRTRWLYISSGTNRICRLPRDLFFRVSAATPVAGPGNICLRLPAGLDSGSFEHIDHWFKICCGAGGYTRMRYFDDIYQDLALCRAARLLGLQVHVQHIHNFYWAYFKKKRIPDYEDLEVVVSLHLPGQEDPFMGVVATRLGHLQYHSEIPDPHEFKEWLMLHPVLESKVTEVLEGLEKAGREKKGPAYTGVGNAWIDRNGWAL